MGLSSKLVSGDRRADWGQTLMQTGTLELPKPPLMRRQQQQLQQQQQSEPLNCPRCDSANTKFCYYNNYNKSQPRHFCKSCKRHWTKGGTLRNVPVGGGRKNKRLKTSNPNTATSSTTSTTTTTTNTNNTHMAIQTQQQRQNLPLALGDQKSLSDLLCQALIRPPYALQNDSINNGIFLGSTPSLPQNQNLHFPFSSSSSFDSNPSSIPTSIQSSNVYNYIGGTEAMEDSTITSIMPTTSNTITQPWQVASTSSVMDMPNYWNWDDIDKFVYTDLNLPWDDSEIKP